LRVLLSLVEVLDISSFYVFFMLVLLIYLLTLLFLLLLLLALLLLVLVTISFCAYFCIINWVLLVLKGVIKLNNSSLICIKRNQILFHGRLSSQHVITEINR